MIEIDINDYVLIKLTEFGHEILEQRHNKLKESYPQLGQYIYPGEDKEGYTKMKLSQVMAYFGREVQINHHLPFNSKILVPSKD